MTSNLVTACVVESFALLPCVLGTSVTSVPTLGVIIENHGLDDHIPRSRRLLLFLLGHLSVIFAIRIDDVVVIVEAVIVLVVVDVIAVVEVVVQLVFFAGSLEVHVSSWVCGSL